MTNRIAELLARCGTTESVMPPTELYNEGWMLRLVLDWFDRNHLVEHALAIMPQARWYSEALLPSAFRPRHRGDRRAESFTHADGVIGHFDIKPGVRGDAVLLGDATQFIVCEAKLGSGLSAGTTNAAAFDQAARNVACMAHMIGIAKVPINRFEHIGFYVIAPEAQIASDVFGSLVTKTSVRAKVQERVAQYEGQLDDWYRIVFEPVLDRIDLAVLSWESILEVMPDTPEVVGLRDFYRECLKFNPLRSGNAGRGAALMARRAAAAAAAADERPLCSKCAKVAFDRWRGWCADGLPDPPPVPDVPRLVDGRCPVCQSTSGVEPGRVGYVNVHGEFSTGLPDFFVLKVLDSVAQVSNSRWGIPYKDLKVGRVPLEDLPRQYPANGWRNRSEPF